MDKLALINAIAAREGTTREIAKWNGLTVAELRQFVEDNREALEQARELIEASEKDSQAISPSELTELWISKKIERLARYQNIANHLYNECLRGVDSTALREFRSYLVAAANELGQLMHRGAGDAGTDSLSVDIQGVDLDNLR